MLGNVIGATLIFAVIVFISVRELSELFSFRVNCARLNMRCVVDPDDFTRSAVYSGLGFFDVGVVFLTSVMVEKRARRREYSPDWR